MRSSCVTDIRLALLLLAALAVVTRGQPGELPGALSLDQQGGLEESGTGQEMNATLGLGANATGVPVYNASLIVPNITGDCPVENRNYPPELFSVDSLVTQLAPLVTAGPATNCTSQATNLATCAFDGSLGVEEGCCSTACAEQLTQLQERNCVPEILALACNATEEQLTQFRGLIPPLIGAAIRCANTPVVNNVTCPDGRVLDIPLTFDQVNGTANGTGAGNSTMEPAGQTGALGEGPVALATPGELSEAAGATGPGADAQPAAGEGLPPGEAAGPGGEPAAGAGALEDPAAGPEGTPAAGTPP